MKKIDSAKGQSAEHSQINLWWPRIVGFVLAIFLLGAIEYSMMITIDVTAGIVAVALLVIVAAISFFWKGISGVIVVRWCTRTVAIPLAVLLTLLFVGGRLTSPDITFLGWASLFLWLVVDAGIVITFFLEGIGGIIVALAALACTLIDITMSDNMVSIFIVFVFCGLASIYCWWRSQRVLLTSHSAA